MSRFFFNVIDGQDSSLDINDNEGAECETAEEAERTALCKVAEYLSDSKAYPFSRSASWCMEVSDEEKSVRFQIIFNFSGASPVSHVPGEELLPLGQTG